MHLQNNKIVFVDFDGVIRVPHDMGDGGYGESQFCRERIKRLVDLCNKTGAEIVVTSDLREKGYNWVRRNLGVDDYLFSRMWSTPKIPGNVRRYEEVWGWMADYPIPYENLKFVILEDTVSHFSDAPQFMKDRVVWCNNRHGFVASLLDKAITMMG